MKFMHGVTCAAGTVARLSLSVDEEGCRRRAGGEGRWLSRFGVRCFRGTSSPPLASGPRRGLANSPSSVCELRSKPCVGQLPVTSRLASGGFRGVSQDGTGRL